MGTAGPDSDHDGRSRQLSGVYAVRHQHLPAEQKLTAELIRRVAGGDHDAFEQLADLHQAPLLRFLRRLTRDEAAALDALQDTLVAAWRGAGGFRGSSTRAWLYGIARNMARRQYRGGARTEESLTALAEAAGFGADSRLLERIAAREQVERAFAALDEEEREILLLRDVEGLPGDETAAVLGITLAAMKSRLHRARLHFMAAAREDADEGT